MPMGRNDDRHDEEAADALREIERLLAGNRGGESLARILFREAQRQIEGDEPPAFGTNPEVAFDELERLGGGLGYRLEIVKERP
jgi:hypothetical protein